MLFIGGTLLDDATSAIIPFYDKEYYGMVIVFFLFILLASFTILNMLIGVLCEVVSKTAEEESEKAKIAEVEEKIGDVYKEIDKDGSGMISREEFDLLQENEVVKDALRDLGIEPKHVFALADSLFNVDDDEELEAEEELVRVASKIACEANPDDFSPRPEPRRLSQRMSKEDVRAIQALDVENVGGGVDDEEEKAKL